MDVSGFEEPTHDAPEGIPLPVIQAGAGMGPEKETNEEKNRKEERKKN